MKIKNIIWWIVSVLFTSVILSGTLSYSSLGDHLSKWEVLQVLEDVESIQEDVEIIRKAVCNDLSHYDRNKFGCPYF